MKTKERKKCGLCYRCEFRAQYNEIGHAPRCECGDVHTAVYSCYMYRPVAPIALTPNDGETRGILGSAMIAGRAHAADIQMEDSYDVHIISDTVVVPYWIPK